MRRWRKEEWKKNNPMVLCLANCTDSSGTIQSDEYECKGRFGGGWKSEVQISPKHLRNTQVEFLRSNKQTNVEESQVGWQRSLSI